jgi:glycosyltransferase involved in cell wall biosynthesis
VSGRIRLAFILPHFRPGGAERVVLNYLRALDRERFEPFLFLALREGAFLDLVPEDVIVADLGGARARRLPGRIARALAGHRIHAAYSATDAANLALLASRWFGARRTLRIVSVHTTPSSWLAEAKHPRLRRWLMRRLYPAAALVAVPAEAIAAELKQLGIPATVLPNPVIDAVLTAGHPAERPLRIVAAGRLVEAKGFDLLIDAAAKLSGEFQLAIHGEGPLRDALSRQVAERDLGERLTLPGHSEPAAIFEGADLCVVPSRREGFGNVVVEAMAAGVPVLAAACPGPAALIEHGHNGFLVEPGSSASLAEAMAALMRDPDRRRAVVDAAGRTAKRFEVHAATRELEAALERLLGKDRPAKHPDPGQALR